MRKKIYWLITSLVFCLGIVVGVFGYMVWQANFQSGINAPKSNATKVSQIDSTPYILPGGQDNSQAQSQGDNPDQSGNPDLYQNAQQQDPAEEQIKLTKEEQEKLLADYKQAIGILFEAWKEKDISAFRDKLGSAYMGNILENHVNKAEKYLSQGVGIYVSDVIFDHLAIESADKYSATVDAIYRYTSQNYDLDEQYPFGEKVNHFVHVKANLIKIDSRWKITSETAI